MANSLNPANAMTVTAGPQDFSHGDEIGYATGQAPFYYDQAYGGDPSSYDPLPPHSNGHFANGEASRNSLPAPSPMEEGAAETVRHESAVASASEDLSGYPLKLREALEGSAWISFNAASSSSFSGEYEIVEVITHIDKNFPEKVMGMFRDRHTANIEAVKIFQHRFWDQVMDDKQEYAVHWGEAGILTMEIFTDGPKGDKILTSVFVRRKGGPGRGN